MEAPESASVRDICFSPSGTSLAALQLDQAVQLWDLRRIRERLVELHLDWDQPAYPEVRKASVPVRADLRVEINDPLEAQRRQFMAQAIPVRSLLASPRLIDLSTFYNDTLSESWHSPDHRDDFAELVLGVRELAAVPFDVRGAIQVGRTSLNGVSYLTS